ncbi:hypothetical protein HOL21_01620 [Candidatus Woesearchaeota archaeon]|jgi:hypothetical protein|nr:hypothetical protein [Candidatus Woesearchaeota archaeon]MBT5396891.1 hypothetical protein [Candidatus Woesearchaeota archaeon]MBT5924965.1 hypothetical protein [Candidatus Woesearchaeota archaeon]MBT6367084.1 hypothetical protein [Candidatus Woesearchaeota archaeon]MBT7762342.1 hypothetical protein [Candidatus Woesearchaeota archaeon]
MENYSIEGDEASTEKHSVEEGNINSSEEAFMQGYNDDEDVEECAECGTAVEKEKKLIKEIDGEEMAFCSETCVKEYMESLSED